MPQRIPDNGESGIKSQYISLSRTLSVLHSMSCNKTCKHFCNLDRKLLWLQHFNVRVGANGEKIAIEMLIISETFIGLKPKKAGRRSLEK